MFVRVGSYGDKQPDVEVSVIVKIQYLICQKKLQCYFFLTQMLYIAVVLFCQVMKLVYYWDNSFFQCWSLINSAIMKDHIYCLILCNILWKMLIF